MKLSKDLREFVALLNSTGVDYLVVGGHAVAYHGFPRYTGDIDFFIDRSEANARKLEEVLHSFGFAGLGISAADFLTPEMVVQLGRPPNRIDLLTSVDGVAFREAWERRVMADLDGLPVPFIGKEDLLRNKRTSGRPQDLVDARRIEGVSE